MSHPLARATTTTLEQLLGKGVKKRTDCSKTLYYRDEENGTATRHIRGVLVVDGRLASLPLPKIVDVATFYDDIDVYHARIQRAIPLNVQYVMPKYDGACVHAVCVGTMRVLHTKNGFDGAEVCAAERMLGDARWDDGVTLAFALTAANTRIHLIYGADVRTGTELEYTALETTAKKIGVSIVKRQLVKNANKIMDIVRTMDDVDEIEQVKAGIVLIDAAGKRYQIRSWHHVCLSRSTIPTKRWLKRLVCEASSIETLHDAVEAIIGPLDAAVIARRMLVDFIVHARSSYDGDENDDALTILLSHIEADDC